MLLKQLVCKFVHICIYVDFLKPSFTAIQGHHIEYFFDWTIYTSRNQHNRQILESLKWWTWRTGHARSIGVFERFLCCQVHSNPAQLVKLLHSSIFRGKCPEDTIHISTSIGWILSCLHLNYDDRQFKELLFLFEQKKRGCNVQKIDRSTLVFKTSTQVMPGRQPKKRLETCLWRAPRKNKSAGIHVLLSGAGNENFTENRETRGLTLVEFI